MTDTGTTAPNDEPSVSIVETAWGTVVRTRNVVGLAAAVKLRRVVLRHPGAVVVLDLGATSVAERVVVAAVADLAAGLRARDCVLRTVRSPHTPQALVAATGAPVYTSLAEALGCSSCPSQTRAVDPPTRSPLPPDDPLRPHPAPLQVPYARRPQDT